MTKHTLHSVNAAKPGFFKRERPKKAKLARMVSSRAYLLATLGIQNMVEKNYIPSALDKADLFSVRTVHLLSRHGGYGLFAKEEIAPGTCIGEYTGQEFTHQEFARYLETTPGADKSYAMVIADTTVDARIKGNFTRYVNFSDSQANIEFVSAEINNQTRVILIATKRIAPGQQLLVDYNVYDERASKYYYFLNPDDTWLSTAEQYDANSVHYEQHTVARNIDELELSADQSIYLTQIGKNILYNEPLTAIDHFSVDEMNLPYIRLENNVIVDALQADLFTPLMAACSLGQVDNAAWLIAHGANVNQQQNHSGNCPLFFALAGYSQHQGQNKPYIDILALLIRNQANVNIHDRMDRTFIHKICSILSPNDFSEVMHVIYHTMGDSFKEIFTYINQDNEDILIHCLNQRDFAKAKVLLTLYPRYFEENLYQGNEQEFNRNAFRNSIQSFSENEKSAFIDILANNHIEVTQDFLVEFNLTDSTLSP